MGHATAGTYLKDFPHRDDDPREFDAYNRCVRTKNPASQILLLPRGCELRGTLTVQVSFPLRVCEQLRVHATASSHDRNDDASIIECTRNQQLQTPRGEGCVLADHLAHDIRPGFAVGATLRLSA